MNKFYITTAIDYVNSIPHLGTAYEKIAADAIARYKRLAGFDTRFLMGNDEHSTNVEKAAREKGLDPQVYCDQMAEIFQSVWKRLDISYDDFIRTTEPRHVRGEDDELRCLVCQPAPRDVAAAVRGREEHDAFDVGNGLDEDHLA